MLGGRTRDAVRLDAPVRTAEYHICRATEAYYKWAVKDGCVDHLANELSLFETIHMPKDVHSSILQDQMLHKLEKLATKWKEALEAGISRDNDGHKGKAPLAYASAPDVPTLYGVIASHTIMAFVSYDPQAATPSLRTVAIFDFGKDGYDVWNCLAIAIFVIHCRNRLMELEEFLPEPSYEVDGEFDPDR